MLLHQVALVSSSKRVKAAELMKVAAALQKQASRDFSPIWGVSATVDCFPNRRDVPVGYWPIEVMDDIPGDGAAGYHEDAHGQPYSLVEWSEDWSLTASHECMEMLGDPFGRRLVAGASPKKGQGRVKFLAEVCDPVEDGRYAYTVNGVVVSDFYTPHFFDPQAASAVRYSFTGALQAPRTILPGGYLTWQDPATGTWWQGFADGQSRLTFKTLDAFQGSCLRAEVDAQVWRRMRAAGKRRHHF